MSKVKIPCTFIAPPVDSFEPSMLPYVIRLCNGRKTIKTGSRLFKDYKPDSDYDFVVLIECFDDDLVKRLHTAEFLACSKHLYADDNHFIFRRLEDNINLILTNSAHKFDLWGKCTNAAIALGLKKAERVVLFSCFIKND